MTRWLKWIPPCLLTVGVVAGGVTAWQVEAAVPAASRADLPPPHPVTPVLSVRRLPTVLAAPIAERRLSVDLAALAATLPPDSCLAVAGPDLRFGHRSDAPVVPASTTKLLTATAALVSLGADARFRTTAVAVAAHADGILVGDLTLVGGGDPILASPDYAGRFPRQPQVFTDLDALAADIREAGVQQIVGAVVGDESRYDQARYVAGWPARYITQNQVGPLSGLAVNDGFERYPQPGGGGDPLTPAAEPATNAAAVLTRLLEARGVDVVGDPRAGAAPAGGVEVAAIESPPLSDVVGQLLQESDNNTAELLLKELGRAAADPTTTGGAAAAQAILPANGLDLTGSVVADGSGLSLDDRVTCDLLVDALGRPGTGQVLQDRLAVAGQSGTLAESSVGTPLAGTLRAKTGSLNTVASLAGVVADDDPPLLFSLILNVPPTERLPDSVGATQQQLGETLLSWPRVPDVSVLGPLTEDG